MHHLDVISRFAPGLGIDVVVADSSAARYGQALVDKVESMGATLQMWDLAQSTERNYHDSEKLTLAFRHILHPESVR